MIPQLRPTVSFEIYADCMIPELSPFTWRQLAARWYGREVKQKRPYYVIGPRIYVHPKNWELMRLAIENTGTP